MALEYDPGIVESTREGVLLSYPEIEDATVTPHHVQVVIGVDLQQQPPVFCTITETSAS